MKEVIENTAIGIIAANNSGAVKIVNKTTFDMKNIIIDKHMLWD
ncbi:hypothetical protein [Fonticella tunisiensis]|uniref:Uncharacterized protein n=1 Tax=Fonticella tunisiensis TaxID=1096341 RepID=A0A4R7KSK2_9CLOT|nr:hypothetical protein [Fonticella tunisiensis]TDT61896.1 hypothetical protein EDD71_10575 [Fonticella tunisiensis]